jgi:hypothetical protein
LNWIAKRLRMGRQVRWQTCCEEFDETYNM